MSNGSKYITMQSPVSHYVYLNNVKTLCHMSFFCSLSNSGVFPSNFSDSANQAALIQTALFQPHRVFLGGLVAQSLIRPHPIRRPLGCKKFLWSRRDWRWLSAFYALGSFTWTLSLSFSFSLAIFVCLSSGLSELACTVGGLSVSVSAAPEAGNMLTGRWGGSWV